MLDPYKNHLSGCIDLVSAAEHKQLADLPVLVILLVHQNDLLVLHLPEMTVPKPFCDSPFIPFLSMLL